MAQSEQQEKQPETESGEVERISGWRYLLLLPLALIMRAWCATVRVRVSEEEKALISDTSTPMVIILWHNRIFIAADIYRRFRKKRKVFGLVSASKDGAWLAAFFSLVGVGAIRGSSSHRNVGATRDLIKAVKAGNDIAITPDGPLGPKYDFKLGATKVARRAEAPLLLISGYYHGFWRLGSWDGFYLPKPFTRAELRVVRLADFSELEAETDQEAASILHDRMMEISYDPETG